MRQRSLSVAYERSNNADSFSKKFEGVVSDHDEDASDYEEENEEDEEIEEGVGGGETGAPNDELWSLAEYGKLVDQLRTVLPKNDKRSHSSRLKSIEWDKVAFDGHTAESVKEQTHSLLKKVRKFRTLAEMLEDVPQVIKKRMRADKPKGPLSSYIHFMKEVYGSYQQRYQTVSGPELVKLIARDFGQLSEKKRAKYERMAEESKKAYQIEMEKYHHEHPESGQPSKKNRSKPVSRSARVTPFSVFCKERREMEPKLSHTELKKMWNELEMNQRLQYIRQAYSNPDADAVNLTKTEKEMLDKAIGKPETVGRSCSDYYVRFHAEPDIQIPQLEWRKLKIQEFKALPKMRRLELELEFRRARTKYIADYQKYIDALPDRERDKELQYLRSYAESVMDKEEKKRLKVGGGGENLTRTAHNTTVNDTVADAHPLAESTTNHFDTPGKIKSKKKKSVEMGPPPTVPSPSKPLKSILKSPSPVKGATSSNKRAIIDEPDTASSVQVPQKKQKKAEATTAAAAASQPSPAREKKNLKSKSQPAPATPSSKESDFDSSDSGVGKKKQTIQPVMNEPRAPPKKLLDYFIQEHYSGKRSKAEEAFNKLSSNRRKEMKRELKAAHKRYVLELEAYFKTLSKRQIEKYLKKIEAKKKEESAEEDESEDDTSGVLPANGTKQEPQTSSSGESDDSEDD
uniref:Putative histone h1 n=1 Tax=Anopheles marajoara TaxID=58244 RepID=A0A2M4BG07_9DIPT